MENFDDCLDASIEGYGNLETNSLSIASLSDHSLIWIGNIDVPSPPPHNIDRKALHCKTGNVMITLKADRSFQSFWCSSTNMNTTAYYLDKRGKYLNFQRISPGGPNKPLMVNVGIPEVHSIFLPSVSQFIFDSFSFN